MNQSAQELSAAVFGQELSQALKQLNVWITNPDDDDDLNLKDPSAMLALGRKVKAALRDIWKDPVSDVFDVG